MNLNSAMKFARKEASAVQTRRIASEMGAIGDPIGGFDIYTHRPQTAGSIFLTPARKQFSGDLRASK